MQKGREAFRESSAGTTKYAQYTYLGDGTMTKVTHPAVSGGLVLSYGSGGTYAGWDRFGRIIRNEWKNDTANVTGFIDWELGLWGEVI